MLVIISNQKKCYWLSKIINSNNYRFDALDALRGLAILLMILSGAIPFAGALPAWMYHAQMPPPMHKFDPTVLGITWVDLVFPFFLFSMGTAFPFSLRKKIESGIPNWKLIMQITQRGIVLAGFAIILQHLKPYTISGSPSTNVWAIGLFGFFILFMLYLRFSKTINKKYVYAAKAIGMISCVILFINLNYRGESSFSLARSDIIILVLANTAFFGSLIWVFTKDNLFIRLGILVLLLAFRLTHDIEGSWTKLVWDFTPFVWLYKFYYLQYLFIVIPGTIVGDLIYKFIKDEKNKFDIKKSNSLILMVLGVLAALVNLILLFSRLTTINIAANCFILLLYYLSLRNETSSYSLLLKALIYWAFYWLLLGLAFEAFEGGIKKDPSTLSFYFVTTGLAILSLVSLSLCFDKFGITKHLKLLTYSGQNPMIAYVGNSNFWMPIFSMTGISSLLSFTNDYPILGFIKGVFITFLVGLLASYFSKKKLFWRT